MSLALMNDTTVRSVEPLDRRDQAGPHRLLKGPAHLQDLGRPAGLDERLLGRGVMLSCKSTTISSPSIVVRAFVGPLPVCSEKRPTTGS